MVRDRSTRCRRRIHRLTTALIWRRASEIHDLNQSFSDIRMKPEDTTHQYTEGFMAAYYKLWAVTRMYCEVHNLDRKKYELPEGAAKLQLFRSTFDVGWLDTWRCNVELEKISGVWFSTFGCNETTNTKRRDALSAEVTSIKIRSASSGIRS